MNTPSAQYGPHGPDATRVFSSWRSLVNSVRYAVPPEHRIGFSRAIAYANWQRTHIFSVVVAVTNVLFGLIPSLVIWSRSSGQVRLVYGIECWWHVFLVLFGLAVYWQSNRDQPASEAEATPRHQRLALLFSAVMLTSMMAFSVLKLPVSGDVTMYLIGIAAVGMLFYLPTRFCAGLYGITFAGLAAGLMLLQTTPLHSWMHCGEALVAISIFWVGSRFVYVLKAMNYVQLTRMSQQAAELAAANRELERAHRFKTELLAAAAHDLRDPLNTIALSAQTMREEMTADAPAFPLVEAINERAGHMAEFIANLLRDATSPTHEITLQREPVILTDFVASLVTHCHAIAEPKQITLHLTIDRSARNAPPAEIDACRFREVVENLITNAVKFSQPGKDVWVGVAYCRKEGHLITVRDEGPGFTADEQSRLFSRFQRLSAQPTAGETSTGLGLSIVKRIVELHGGAVRAESPGPDRGATFTVVLP